MNGSLPSLESLKDQAKRLRAGLDADGMPIPHSKSLELLARQYGYKDWNTLHAAAGNRPPAAPVAPGDRVRGTYLGQRFEAEVIGVAQRSAPGLYRITLHFDEPVDGFHSFPGNLPEELEAAFTAARAAGLWRFDERCEKKVT